MTLSAIIEFILEKNLTPAKFVWENSLVRQRGIPTCSPTRMLVPTFAWYATKASRSNPNWSNTWNATLGRLRKRTTPAKNVVKSMQNQVNWRYTCCRILDQELGHTSVPSVVRGRTQNKIWRSTSEYIRERNLTNVYIARRDFQRKEIWTITSWNIILLIPWRVRCVVSRKQIMMLWKCTWPEVIPIAIMKPNRTLE